ncbi:MAG: aldo/keto reductase [Clostridia bacterium]|nr:aldo/keto reductase [Clostridia bacterium]
MRLIQLGKSTLNVPTVAVGCMRINGLTEKEVEAFVRSAMDEGANFFDHADIYGRGACEEIFSKSIGINAKLREKMILQSKCGIVPGVMFDFSKEHILASVDGSLKRLRTDYLDVLLLHRPDALVEPDEVAEAFDRLYTAGKVRHFGVSNQNPGQIRLLGNSVRQPIVANQLQFGIAHAGMLNAGIHVNMLEDASTDRDGGILDYCRLNGITVQPWSPLQYGFFEGVFIGNNLYPELNKVIDEIAARYGVSATTLAFAWILRHPAKMQPVTGTTNSSRLRDCIRGAEITITREEWYAIYTAAGNTLP